MKADIDENGKLTIRPETPTESYALACWWEDYSNGPTTPGRAVLHVEVIEGQEPQP